LDESLIILYYHYLHCSSTSSVERGKILKLSLTDFQPLDKS